MPTETIVALVLLLVGWVIINAPTQLLFPFLIVQQLGSRDARLERKLKRIPVFRIGKRADAVEKLLRKPQNKQFMSVRFPVTLKWYEFAAQWRRRILIAFFALVVVSQVWGVGRFVLDPKGELDRLHSAAEHWRSDTQSAHEKSE